MQMCCSVFKLPVHIVGVEWNLYQLPTWNSKALCLLRKEAKANLEKDFSNSKRLLSLVTQFYDSSHLLLVTDWLMLL